MTKVVLVPKRIVPKAEYAFVPATSAVPVITEPPEEIPETEVETVLEPEATRPPTET
jgi:hypothetical protein